MTLTARVRSSASDIVVPVAAPVVASVSELRALAGGPTVPSAVFGHSTMGGVFFWDSASATDDGGHRMNSGGLGSSGAGWQRFVETTTIDVMHFGAAGDGVTDDTAPIQRACALLQSRGGGALLFTRPHAIFTSSHATPLGSFSGLTGIKLICQGGSLILPAIEWALLGFWPCFEFDGCNDITVDGFTCTGGTLNHATNVGSGVVLVDFEGMASGGSNLTMPQNRLSGAWSGARFNQPYTEDGSKKMRKIQIGYLEVSGGTYGITARYSGDDMTIGMLKTQDVYRSLFTVGVSNVRAYVDSADHHGSHDVLFIAQEDWSVENCHVHYVCNRDTGSGAADNIGVVFGFHDLNNSSPPVIKHCSVKLDVALPAFGTNSLINAFVFEKTNGDGTVPDTTDRGYVIHDFKVSGRVDMNDRGAQAVLLSPPNNWASGEFASNIDLSDLAVFNSVGTTPAIWFPIARALVGPLTMHNTRVDSDRDITLFGNGGSSYYPPDDKLVNIGAVQCANRWAKSGGAIDSFALHQGAGYERIGGWNGVDLYANETQVGRLINGSGSYVKLGASPYSATGNIRGSNAASFICRKADNLADLNAIQYDGGNVCIVGDGSNALTQLRGGTAGVSVLVGGNTLGNFYGTYVELGAGSTPATTGLIRLGNAGSVYARNSGGSGNLNLIQYDGGDVLIVGDTGNGLTQIRGPAAGVDILCNGTSVNTSTSTTVNLRSGSNERFKVDGTGVGFFGVTPAARPSTYTQTYSSTSRTVNAYTSDAESSAYTGIDNAQGGTPYAQLTDLNSLRTAYETLRASHDNLLNVVGQILDDLQAYGLLQ